MFKETCLVAHKWIERSPHIKCLENPRVVVAPAWNHIIMGTQSIKMQQTCIINAWNERWSDYEDFDARIAEIRVAVEKIWWKEFQRLICNFWKVARVNFWTIFRFQGSVWNIVDCCLILDNNRGLFTKVPSIFQSSELFLWRKGRGPHRGHTGRGPWWTDHHGCDRTPIET
jgi:hypothetical protein